MSNAHYPINFRFFSRLVYPVHQHFYALRRTAIHNFFSSILILLVQSLDTNDFLHFQFQFEGAEGSALATCIF